MPGPITKALEEAVLKGAKGAKVLRPAEKELAAQAAEKELRAKAAQAPAPIEPGAAPEVQPTETPTLQPVTAEPVTPAGVVDDAQTVPVKSPVETPTKPAPIEPPPPEEVQRVAGRISNSSLGDYALDDSHMPNFDRIATTDDVKSTIAEIANTNKVAIDEARRGVITNDQLLGLAGDLNLETDVVQKVMQRETGGILNAETIIAARRLVNSSADQIKALADNIASGQASDAERVRFVRQLQLHKEFFTSFMGARAEAGRALNAFGIPVGGDARVAQKINDILQTAGVDVDSVARAVSMTDSTAGISKIAAGPWYKRAAGATLNLINRNFVNGILSGPPTHFVNSLGNALFQSMNAAEISAAARLGRFLPGEEHVQTGEALATLHGMLNGTSDAWRLASKALKSGQTLDNIVKYGVKGEQSTLARLPELDKPYLRRVVQGIDAATGISGRALSAEDEFFKTLAYRSYVERQALLHVQDQIGAGTLKMEDAAAAARKFMEDAPDDVQASAEDWAREMTFQNPLGPIGQDIQRALRRIPIGTLIAPFIQTPTNIFKQATYRSPFALFSQKFWSDVNKGGAARDLALTRFAMGSATAALVTYAVANDNLTGAGPQNPKARQLWMENGKRPYSVKVTNPTTGEVTWHSYARMEPVASVVGAIADATEIYSTLAQEDESDQLTDEESKYRQAAGSIIAGIMNNTGNKTFMKGISDFVELLNDPARNIQSYGNQIAAAQVPYSALQRTIRNFDDPYLREAWTVIDKIKDNAPGYSKDLPLRLDLFGQPREKNSSTLLGAMSPIPESPEKYDDVVKELVDVMHKTSIVPVTMPEKRVGGMDGLGGLKLNAREYSHLVELARNAPINGKNFHDALATAIDSSVYQNATPTMRAHLLRSIQTQYDKVASSPGGLLEKEDPQFAVRIADWRMQQQRLLFDK